MRDVTCPGASERQADLGKSKMANNPISWMAERYVTIIEHLKAVSEHDFHRLRCFCEEISLGKFTLQEKFIGRISYYGR